MEAQQNEDIMLYLAVFWKKLTDIEHQIQGGGKRIAPITTYLRELEQEVEKVARQMR